MTQEQLNHAGGTAFPVPNTGHYGMTLREYFAGQVLVAIAPFAVGTIRPMSTDSLPAECVRLADALIAEIKRTTPPRRADD